MRKRQYMKALRYFFILVFFCLSIFFQQASATYNAAAQKGIVNLSSWDFNTKGNVRLTGEWAFFWKKLIRPEEAGQDSLAPDFYIIQPRSWADVQGTPVKPTEIGYATYRLKVIIPSEFRLSKSLMGIAVKDCHMSCTVFINGQLVARQGKVTSNPKDFVPKYQPFYKGFIPVSDTLDILIQVANFFDANQGGIDDHVLLGTFDNIKKSCDGSTMIFIFSFGILLIISFYHLFLYLFNRTQKYNYAFMLACLSLAIMALCIGERAWFFFLPDFSVPLFLKIWYSSVVVVWFMNLFFYYFFPGEIKKRTIQIISGFFILNTLLAFILPVSVYTVIINYLLVGVLIAFLYMFVVLIRCIRHKRQHAIIVFIGMLIPLIIGANDILYAMDLIMTGYYGPIGYLAYVFTQSVIISWRFSQSYKQVESLSNELEAANRSLEKKVQERTIELQKVNEELQNLIKTKDRFFSIVTHDLRTSFQALKNLSIHLLEQTNKKDCERSQQLAEWINQSAEQTNKLLENLVEWARIQSGRMPFMPEEFNLYNLVQDIFQMFAFTASQKDIFLKTSIRKDQVIYADYNMMHLILRNLVSNSIKFTEKGGVIKVDCQQTEKEYIVSVSDTGIGIPEKIATHLFTLEKNNSTAGTNNEKGSGLGLILCKECVLKHKGKITLETRPGKGTTFYVHLPLPASSHK